MITCRLLCALLVLALCCCPSVCAEEGPTDKLKTTTTNNTTKAQNGTESQGSDLSGSPTNESVVEQGKSPVTGHLGSSGSGFGVGSGIVDGDEKSSTGILTQSDDATDNLQREGNKDTTGSQSSKKPSTEEENKKGEDTSETTATTTKEPTTTTTTAQATTTTTTTTTTKAPSTTTTTTQAPNNTTTEVPTTTTTTTRTPSRLREIDGSLSSSAWVCAPLLLAVSALAYTTLG
ncbi:putative mucin TcMUCII [Trypanosoma cruzi]|uniref:Mucin TcMUCII, putative n=2 Tax=Trypanosoma cruzi TaxID=5693 RepID=Q4E1G7_TRYCC|nr:mucin TcMUCII, putative [Trypanosoma cruzi]EAN98610.1 mucin TcMUCII, putative [Trypanosoma cruzi]PWV11276.1 putative mucin TcMUCII [Trypanosoma cruzi]|eukprot:XP_820461.1 mucin TcMUCII [Trypanosoma cruzi strain CL Brener]